MPRSLAYDDALVCRLGHVVNNAVARFPHRVETRCHRCGSVVVDKCASCDTAIRGNEIEVSGGDIFLSDSGKHYRAPAHCHNCGEPFPWTQEVLRFVEEQASTLSPGELAEYKKSLDLVVREHPASAAAAMALRRLHALLGNESVEMIRAVLANILADALTGKIFSGR